MSNPISTPLNELAASSKKLRAESSRIKKRREARQKQDNADARRIEAISVALHRNALLAVVGMPGCVCHANRFLDPAPEKVGNKPGTLTEVRRTRCDVDFGSGGLWDFLLTDICVRGDEAIEIATKAKGGSA